MPTSKKPIANYSGKLKEMTSGDLIPIANLASGTPDGTQFIRDDGVLAVPAGGGGGGMTLGQSYATNQGTNLP